jgi:hypothetical protein
MTTILMKTQQNGLVMVLVFHKPDINDWYETVKINYGVSTKWAVKDFDELPEGFEGATQFTKSILNFGKMKTCSGVHG